VTYHPQIGVVRFTRTVFFKFRAPIICLKRVKLDISNLACRLIVTRDRLLRTECDQVYVTTLNLGKYVIISLETVHDRGVVRRLIGNHMWPIEWNQH